MRHDGGEEFTQLFSWERAENLDNGQIKIAG
jgi:hypothetical protein